MDKFRLSSIENIESINLEGSLEVNTGGVTDTHEYYTYESCTRPLNIKLAFPRQTNNAIRHSNNSRLRTNEQRNYVSFSTWGTRSSQQFQITLIIITTDIRDKSSHGSQKREKIYGYFLAFRQGTNFKYITQQFLISVFCLRNFRLVTLKNIRSNEKYVVYILFFLQRFTRILAYLMFVMHKTYSFTFFLDV